MPTLSESYKKPFVTLKVAIVGDIEHSRVAKSEIYILNKLGVQRSSGYWTKNINAK